jgi:hypothetical protein
MRAPLVVSLLLVSPAARAADPSFSSDRPTFSNSTASVPFGRLVVEGGLATAVNLEDHADPTLFLPEALVRVGLPLGLEARIQAPSLGLRPDPRPGTAAEEVGASDLGLGVKLSLAPLLPVSGVATMTVPLEVNGFGASDEVTATFNVNAAFDIVPGIGVWIAGFLGHANDDWQGSAGVGLGFGLGPLSPYAQAFVERSASSVDRPVPGQRGPSHLEVVTLGIGAGLTWMVLERLQLDASFDLLPVRATRLLEDRETSTPPDLPVALRAGFGATFLL